METKNLTELTKLDIYKKDLPRIADLTYDESGKKTRTRPDVIGFLLNYYHDTQLTKKS